MIDSTTDSTKAGSLLNNMPAVIITLIVIDSLHFVFARLLHPYLPPTAGSFYYMTVATIQIAIYAAVRRKIDASILRDNLKFFLIIGFLIGFATATSFAAVAYIDPGTASLIARSSTVFGMLFGYFWLKERLSRGERIGAVISIAGVFIISFQPGNLSELTWLGPVLVLLASFTYALHAAIVKHDGGDMDFLNFFLFRMLSSILFLFIFMVGRGELVWPQGREVWTILLLAGTFNVTVSRSLYYMVLRRFRLSILTILLTLSPAMTVLWSYLLFGVLPSLQGVIGGTIVIGGVILVAMSRQKRRISA